MRSAAPVLMVVGDAELAGNADRVAAAAGTRLIRDPAPARKSWVAASAVLLDEDSARRCAGKMPRRDGVILLVSAAASTSAWSAAVAVGAQHVYCLPADEAEFIGTLADAAERGAASVRPGRVIAVVPGKGGGGASILAAALAQCAGHALLIDLDPYAAGVDLLLGLESEPGLRWPDLSSRGGRLTWAAVREALPRRDGLAVLSGTRAYHEIDPALVASVAEAGRRGGATVVCDLPRQFGSPAACAIELADLVVVVTCCDVRAIAAAAAVAGVVRTMSRNVGLAVRGPSPGGLSAKEAVEAVGAPLLAAYRPDPLLPRRLERGGLHVHRRSALAAASHRVLAAAGAAERTG